jgi:CheY-specific phosphatase CheX
MDPKYSEALIEVIQRTFHMMFDLDVCLYQRRREESQMPPFEVSGVIGITGPNAGSVVVSFPSQFAHDIAVRTFGAEDGTDIADEDVYDCVGEVANVIGGNLLPVLQDGGADHRISLPSVVVGTHRVVWRRKDTPYELLLFQSEAGDFGAGLSLRKGD